jgi:hypothetical protein
MGCDHSLGLKEFLDQLNFLYIWICLYLQQIKSYGHVSQKDILKLIYYFMILFLTIYIFKYFLLLVPFRHQGSAIMFSF